MVDSEFTEREGFGGLGEFGELPDDLRGMGPNIARNGAIQPGVEKDTYQTVGGAQRENLESIPMGFTTPISFRAINYLPRANFESIRTQRLIMGATALLPPNPAAFVDLLVDTTTLPPNAPVKFSTGPVMVPQAYAAIITGIRQWVGDSTAIQQLNGEPDAIIWRVSCEGTPIFDFNNFPLMMSSLDEEGKLFAVVNESTTIQLSVKNNISPTDPNARSIPIQAILTGHWFPIDELNDIFRNR